MGTVVLPLRQMYPARRSLCFLVEISSYFPERAPRSVPAAPDTVSCLLSVGRSRGSPHPEPALVPPALRHCHQMPEEWG